MARRRPLWAVTNRTNQSARQTVSVPLAPVAGRRGTIRIVFTHVGSNYSYASSGATVSGATLSAISFPSLPEAVVWTETEHAAHPLPEIRAVTSVSAASPAVQEGFYRECASGGNVFFVSCSPGVTRLEARPSHLSLVPDEAVEVFPLGGGRFAVTVDGSGIDDANDRTRMILTLVASDGSGGPAAYKDLSLRFSSATTPEAYVPSEKATATPVPVPYAWLVARGLAAEDTSDAEMDAAAAADPDGDGQPTYAEYLCGTDPTDGRDFLTAYIRLEGGEPVISWNRTNALARYTVVGATNLHDRAWSETNAANRAGMRFFRVRATPR